MSLEKDTVQLTHELDRNREDLKAILAKLAPLHAEYLRIVGEVAIIEEQLALPPVDIDRETEIVDQGVAIYVEHELAAEAGRHLTQALVDVATAVQFDALSSYRENSNK